MKRPSPRVAATAALLALLTAAAVVAGQTPVAADSSAGADSVAARNEWARRFNERQAAIRDSLEAEAEAWHYEHKDMTVEEQISDLNARILADPRNGDLYNNLGVLYAERGDWVLARDAFISAVQSAPQEADYHRNLALVFVRLENYDLAVSELQAYQRLAPDGGPDAWRRMGEAYRQAGLVQEARDAFTTALAKLPPEQGDERMRAALALFRLESDEEQPEAARALLEQHLPEAQRLVATAVQAADSTAAAPARALVAQLVAGYVEDANVLMDSDLPADAAALYARAYAAAPERDDVLAGSVAAYLAAGQREEAAVLARGAVQARPQAAGSWVASGRVAEDGGDVAAAAAAYEKALALDRSRTDVKLRLGNLYLVAGQNENARRVLADVVSDPTTPAPVLYNYAVSLIRDQKWLLAIDPLRRTVKADPRMAPAWSALGLALRNTEQYAAAADAYRQALAIAPDPKLHYNLGFSLSRAGQTADAIASYREAVKGDPAFREAWYGLARAHMEAKQYEEAVAALEKNLELDPESYQAWFALGLARYHLGRFQPAIDAYNQALARRETAEAYQNMGLAFDKLGKKEEAARCYREAKKTPAGTR